MECIDYFKEVLEKVFLEDIFLMGVNMFNFNVFNLVKEVLMFMCGGSVCVYISFLSIEYVVFFVGNVGVVLVGLMSDEIYLCVLDCVYIKGFKKYV